MVIYQDITDPVVTHATLKEAPVATIAGSVDYVVFVDATDGEFKRVLADDLPGGGGGGGVTDHGDLTGLADNDHPQYPLASTLSAIATSGSAADLASGTVPLARLAGITTTQLGGDITAAGKALIDDADAAAQRTTLGLGTAAQQPTSAFEAAGAVATHAALTSTHGISTFGATLVDDASAAAARTTLGVDSAGTAASAVAAHEAAADPHTGYQKESEKGAANGYASLGAGGLVPIAQLATGTPDGTKFVRDDGTLQVPAGGGGTPATSVVSETSFAASPAVGTSTNYAREDHTHGTPTVAAVATSGSASDLTSGTLPIARIADGAVTLAKLADLAQDQFIGRTIASTGEPQTATITAAARTVLDDTTVSAMVDTLGGASATGSGGLVRATSPTLNTPHLGIPTAGDLGSCTGVKLTTGIVGTLAIGNGGTGATTAISAMNALQARGADIASASTLNLNSATGDILDVTGTTTITAITLTDGDERKVRFTGALTLTNGASLVLPGGANITTVAGDCATFRGYASSVVRCTQYQKVTVTGSGSQVLATSPALTTPNIGTPSAGTLTSCTGLPISTGVSGLASGIATFLATPSSANLRSAMTDESGSGAALFASGALGTPASGVLTNCTGLPVAGGGTGVATLTAYAPIFGGTTGTGAVQSGTAGTTGYALLSNGAAAIPTFQRAWRHVVKTGNQVVNTTTLTADTDLTISMTSGDIITFRGVVYVLTSAANDFKWSMSGPTLGFFQMARHWIESATAAFGGIAIDTALPGSTTISTTSDRIVIHFDGIYQAASTASFVFNFAPVATTDANATMTLVGSHISWMKT